MIQYLIQNILYMNQDKEGVREYAAEQRARYEKMTDLQIQNIFMINC